MKKKELGQSCMGVLTGAEVNGGRLGGIVKSLWSWIYSAGWQSVSMC